MGNATGGNAYIPGGAGGGVGIAAGGATQTSGTVVFSNSNGVTFGYNNGTITATVTPGAAAGIAAAQAGTQTQTSGTAVFANSNNVSFGMSGSSQITASMQPGVSALSAGAASVSAGAVVLSNSNGLSFGLNGSTITGSYTVPGATVFSNSNGLTFGLAGSTVTASYNSTSAAGQGTTFAGTNISASMTLNTAGLNLALAGAAAGGGSPNFSAGTTSNNLGSVVFSNSNGMSFGLNGSTITGSVAAQSAQTQSNIQAISAGTTSANTGAVVFSNSNGVSFGLNGQTVTGSVAAQTNQTLGLYGSSQTTGQSSSSTIDARSLTVVGAGNISVGMSAGSLVVSGAAGGQTNQSLGIYASSQTTGQSSSTTVDARSLTLVGAGVISIGASGGSIYISSPGTTNFANLSVSAGTTSASLGSLVFSNSNGVSFGLNGSTITASAAAGGGAALSAGTQSTNGGTVAFSNSNNISFGMSNSSVITASASYSQVSSVGLYALGNTTQNSSTTLDMRTLSFNALGAMTMGYTNGSIQVSAPATSSLSATGGLSISTNGSTISIGQGALTRAIWPVGNLTAISAPGNASMSFQYLPMDNALTATRMDALVSWAAGSSATTNTCAIALSMYGAIYTRNGASLSSLSSGSTQTTYSYASNSAGRTELITGAVRPLSVPINISMSQGEYFVGFNFITATSSIGLSTTNCPQTFSMLGGNQIQTGLNYAEIGSQTNASVGLYSGMGVYSAASTGLPAAVSISGIVQTGASLSQANLAVVFRNA